MEQNSNNTYQTIALFEQYFSHQKVMLYQHTIQIFPLFWKFVTVAPLK